MASVPAAHRSFVASCLYNSLFPSLIRRLCILVSSSVKGIESKNRTITKPKCKACHNKTYYIYASYNGEDAHARSKRKSQFDSETVCSQSGRQEPHKAKLLLDAPFPYKSIATLHTLLASQPLRNEVSTAVRPE